MSGGQGFLEFFILEASDYVEQLDGLLLGGGSSGPDGDALQRAARALRGTATMAKIPAFADLAGAIERVGRALHEGSLRWDPALGGALVAAIDDLKSLLHAARNWSPADDRRAATRSAELARYAPPRTPTSASPAPGGAASGTHAYLSTEATNIAAGLELLTTRAGDADTASNVLRRIRALRGVAGVKEVGPLADALESIEEAGRPLEGHEALTPAARRLLETAAAYLRSLATALRNGGDVNAPSSARNAFEAACETWSDHSAERERVVPISDLFYSDGSMGLVEESPHPPTTAAERFRLELVSLGEHLRQVVDSARKARDPVARTRLQRELRRALQALEAAADSFGEREVADFVRAHGHATNTIDFLGLSALEDLASILSEPGAGSERLRARVTELAGRRDMATAIGAGFGRETPMATPSVPAAPPIVPTPIVPTPHAPPPSVPEPESVPTPVAVGAPVSVVAADLDLPAPTPTPVPEIAPEPAPGRSQPTAAPVTESLDDASAALIDSSIAALESFAVMPMLPQTPLPEEQGEIVPIESLLFRGRSALDRALEVRDQIRRTGDAPDPDALEELFDLLELARVD